MIGPCCFRNWLRHNNGNAVLLGTIHLLDEGSGLQSSESNNDDFLSWFS
jgi:hypothetical protein